MPNNDEVLEKILVKLACNFDNPERVYGDRFDEFVQKNKDKPRIAEALTALHSYIEKEKREAVESTTKRIEAEAYQAAYDKMRDELERVSHPAIRVTRREGDIFIVEQLVDVQYGGDVIQVTIAALRASQDGKEG